MKVTVKYLEKLDACKEAVEEYKKQGKEYERVSLIQKMIKQRYRLDWAEWLIVHDMTYQQYVDYAIYAVEQGLDIYEKKYPNDNRPRDAIKAAQKCIGNPTEKNKATARAAWAAGDAWAARVAPKGAWAAGAAAWAAWAVAGRCFRTQKKMQIKILRYGIKLSQGR